MPYTDTLHYLHLSKRTDRKELLLQQFKEQGITEFVEFEGEIFRHSRKKGITRGFQRMVRYAKENNYPYIHLAEDDLMFTHPKSWKYYLSQLPEDYDCFWSFYYVGSSDRNNRITSACSGMTLITVNSRFYDFFLNLPEDVHVDRELTKHHTEFIFKTCPLIPAYQSDGFSDNTLKHCEFAVLLENRELYIGQTF